MTDTKKNRQRGKRAQKNISDILGGLNIGTLGGVDILNEDFLVEVKDFSRFAGEKILQQAEKHKKTFGENKKAIGVVHIRGTQYKNSIVLIRLKDFLDILNKSKNVK